MSAGNPFVDKLFSTALADAAVKRSASPRNANSSVLMFCAEVDATDAKWYVEGFVHGTRKQGCRAFRAIRELKGNGYLVHVSGDGKICCFTGIP